MEELKLLVEMVANLPSMALWVIAFFFAYKVMIVGSIYGVIKFVVGKVHDVMVAKKTAVPIVQEVEMHATLDAMTISSDGSYPALVAQLHRLKPMSYAYPYRDKSTYIHMDAVVWLRAAIDDKLEKDREHYKDRN